MNSQTIGDHPADKPDGMLRPITFPQLLVMDTPTGDGRLLDSAGAGVRELPRPIYFQKAQAPGHDGAVAVGRLDEVTFTENDAGTKIASGRGWLIDTAEGREAAQYVVTKTIFHNSVDLNDVKVQFELVESGDDDLELQFRFTEWRIGGTTLVGSPAFADAHAALDEELQASLDPLAVHAPTVIDFDVDEPETTADGATRVPWADFYTPEPNHRQKIIVTEDGHVYGHLAMWNEPHEGFPNRLRYPPRPADGYASFNQPGPLTEHGQVETGPIFLLGGHPDKPLGNGDPYKAYGGVENCWADVRVTEGIHGPWISGHVRPGVDDVMLYAARASRISGHWVGDRLRAITSCNVEGFPVGGSGVVGEAVIRDGEVLELVASYQGDDADFGHEPILWSEIDHLVEALADRLTFTETIDAEVELDATETWTADEVADAVVAKLNATRFTAFARNGEPTDPQPLMFVLGDKAVDPEALVNYEHPEMKATPKHSTSTTDSAWDAAANEKRLPSPMPAGTANRFYAWVDSSASEDGKLPKSAGKLPHHEVSADGSPGAANTHALAAAMAALHGGRGGVNIPEADRAAVHAHLAAHYRAAGMEPPELASEDDLLQIELDLVD